MYSDTSTGLGDIHNNQTVPLQTRVSHFSDIETVAKKICSWIQQVGDPSRFNIHNSHGPQWTDARDGLMLEVLQWQSQHIPPFARLVRNLNLKSGTLCSPQDFPALPTDTFRWTHVDAFSKNEPSHVFRSSGTTQQHRSTHRFKDLSLYNAAAYTAARIALFPDVECIKLIMLAPHESEAKDSSLSYMLSRFETWFGCKKTTWAWKNGKLDIQSLIEALRSAEKSSDPVALLGTSFAFVHAEDALNHEHFNLPIGSRIMQTGGFKGKSRVVDAQTMEKNLSDRYGVHPHLIVSEYGMTELSSQMYSRKLLDHIQNQQPQTRSSPSRPDALWVPPWVHAYPVDPVSLQSLPMGQTGILRIEDLANVFSCCAIQTQDLAKLSDEGLVLLGRVPSAIARGCSITADDLLQ